MLLPKSRDTRGKNGRYTVSLLEKNVAIASAGHQRPLPPTRQKNPAITVVATYALKTTVLLGGGAFHRTGSTVKRDEPYYCMESLGVPIEIMGVY